MTCFCCVPPLNSIKKGLCLPSSERFPVRCGQFCLRLPIFLWMSRCTTESRLDVIAVALVLSVRLTELFELLLLISSMLSKLLSPSPALSSADPSQVSSTLTVMLAGQVTRHDFRSWQISKILLLSTCLQPRTDKLLLDGGGLNNCSRKLGPAFSFLSWSCVVT